MAITIFLLVLLFCSTWVMILMRYYSVHFSNNKIYQYFFFENSTRNITLIQSTKCGVFCDISFLLFHYQYQFIYSQYHFCSVPKNRERFRTCFVKNQKNFTPPRIQFVQWVIFLSIFKYLALYSHPLYIHIIYIQRVIFLAC